MFDDLISLIDSLDGTSVSIPIDEDENGFIDRQCPGEKCEFSFKVKSEHWEQKSEDSLAWCPMCRHEADVEQWYTHEQLEHAKSEATALVESRIGEALVSGARN